MAPPAVVVVDAETPGNVGTIARAMKNFGFSELLLVDPPPLDPDGEAYGFAGHAREDVLPDYREVAFEEVVDRYHTVGFTAIAGETETRHVRYPFLTPAELADELRGLDADVALVFGREGRGLNNDELARLDRVCSIPASEEYPVLNLGQAATVALYELRGLALDARDTQLVDSVHDRATEPEIEGLYHQFDDLLDAVDHPEEKRPKTRRLLRRLFGRADPTGREVSTLRGVVRRAADEVRDASGDPRGPGDADGGVDQQR